MSKLVDPEMKGSRRMRPGGNPRISLKLVDAAVLLWNLLESARDPEIGYNDAHTTLRYMRYKFRWSVMLRRGIIENCLYACNMMAEKGKFVHPDGRTFEEFLTDIFRRHWKFNTKYNLLERDEEWQKLKQKQSSPKDSKP